MTMTITTDVQKLAYELWEQNGRPHGRDQEFYYTAERMLSGTDTSAAPKKATRTRTAASDKPKTTRTRTKKEA